MRGPILAAIVAFPAASFAQADPGVTPSTPTVLLPPLTMKLTNETGELGVRTRVQPLEGMTLTPALRGGLLAPTGGTGTPYSVLKPSPYFNSSMQAGYTGPWEAFGSGTLGVVNLNSHRSVASDGSPAEMSSQRSQNDFSQHWLTVSGYLDTGKVADISKRVKAAFFAAIGTYAIKSLDPTLEVSGYPKSGSPPPVSLQSGYLDQWLEANFGTLWMYKKGRDEVTAIADFNMDQVFANAYRNNPYGVMPSGMASVEYGRDVGSLHEKAGVEVRFAPSDFGARPYAGLSGSKAQVLVAGNLRDSLNPFYPNVQGAGLEVRVLPGQGVSLNFDGSVNREAYPLAPQPYTNASAFVSLGIDDSRLYSAQFGYRSVTAANVPGDLDGYRSSMNSQLPGRDYVAFFQNAFQTSDTYQKFLSKIPAGGTDEILSALSVFTSTFNANNYNFNQDKVPNVTDPEQLYRRARQSWLTGVRDPILVCKGAAQFAAILANDMGARLGIPIAATAVNVKVPAGQGQAGHMVTAVVTPEYGIVFVDWGRLTPTYTWDTQTSLAVYQGMIGIPEIAHAITAGTDGHTIGYLFSEDGKTLIRNLMYHGDMPTGPLPRIFNDDPRTYELTLQRYRDIVRAKFDQDAP